ncbi:MAG: 5'-nucleotidase C-terminal domain-containing protein [Candidatus Fermentibacteraceae bacterium]|nr:5'-nucleotidase C-terminal domain-containing protein [Candidatus Fermentibacteraceae bacterium]
MRILLNTVLVVLLLWSSAHAEGGFVIEILHLNDTHSNLIPAGLKIYPFPGDDRITIPAGSVARTASEIAAIRATGENVVFLHAGDLVQGTLFYTVYGGAADADVYNVIRPDVMTLGNHEFDRGSEGLAHLLDQLRFPVVCANIDVSSDSLLTGRIRPCTVLEVGGERIGVVGLLTEELQSVSSPSPETVLLPLAGSAQAVIDSLHGLGVNKIIILSHIGYENDLQLASQLTGADVIVGGHSHTLLGDFSRMGLDPQGDYPTVVQAADGRTVLVVQAWRYGQVLGRLRVEFDEDGSVEGFTGSPVILTGEPFLTGSGDTLSGPFLESFLAVLEEDPLLSVVPEDGLVAGIVESYSEAISGLEEEPVAEAEDDLPHIRIPGGNLPGGSMIAPIVCDALLWKANEIGAGADIALQNAGGVRIDIPKGWITVGAVYRLLPFSNTLAVLDISGQEMRETLENALTDIFDGGCSDGAFPYVAGMRFTALRDAPSGQRITDLEVRGPDGSYMAIDPSRTYRLVTNAFVAGGGDGYSMLAGRPFTDTGFTDSEVFIEYLEMMGTVQPVEQRVFLVDAIE